MDLRFYKGKKVLLTGHTGFKGSWMSVMLVNAGAEVIGYSSCNKDEVRLFDLCGIKGQITHIKGDVRDLEHLMQVFKTYQPEIVIHMAAQPIVRTSYKDPVETYNTNVMGTVNILECIRLNPCVKSFLNVTTDGASTSTPNSSNSALCLAKIEISGSIRVVTASIFSFLQISKIIGT